MEVSYEYVMVARLEEIYSPNIIASSIFIGLTQAPIVDTTSREEPVMAPVANTALYCTVSVFFENDALNGGS